MAVWWLALTTIQALHVVDAESGQTLQIFQNLALPASGSTSLCFRRDATGLAIAREAGCLLLDLRTGEVGDFGPGAKFVCFAPDDRLVLKLGAAGQCGLCDADTGERLRSLEGCDGPTQVGDFGPMARRWPWLLPRGWTCFKWRPERT